MKARLLESEQDDLGTGSNAHWRTPGSGSARCIHLQFAEPVQSVGEFTEDAPRQPGEGEELSAMGVAGELEADAGLLDDGQTAGHVVEQNARFAGEQMQALQRGRSEE